jgi:hypothetical protein
MLGQDSWDRKAWARTAGTGKPGQDSQDRTVGIGQSRPDSLDR